MGATEKTKAKRWRTEGEPTRMVVSSEDVISVWPFWLNLQCSTVLVCPDRVAKSFPEGTSNTWEEQTNISNVTRVSKSLGFMSWAPRVSVQNHGNPFNSFHFAPKTLY